MSNKVFYEDLITSDDDIITHMDKHAIEKVIDIIEQEAAEYNEYKRLKEMYEIFQKFKNRRISVDKIPPEMLIDMMENDFDIVK